MCHPRHSPISGLAPRSASRWAHSREGVVSVLVAVLLLTGCYTYRPAVTPGPAAGTRISAEITREGATALSPMLGPDISEIHGTVVESGADTLRVSVLSITNQRGIPASWQGELVPLPRAQLTHLGERRLATGGTVLLSAVATGGLYLLYRMLGGPAITESSGGGSPGGGR